MSGKRAGSTVVNLAVVIVTYNPDEGLERMLALVTSEVHPIIVVDNGSEPSRIAWIRDLVRGRAQLIENGTNAGLAHALNQGLKLARDQGCSWALTLDQDSMPTAGMLPALATTLVSEKDSGGLAVLAAQYTDPRQAKPARYLRSRGGGFFSREVCQGERLEDVTLVLNSGAVFNLGIFEALDGFRDDFFIDHVDGEYCLRARASGYKIQVNCHALLEHRIGDRVQRRLGPLHFYPTFHSPVRWYYISRNRIPMLRMYALKFPHWLSFELVSSIYIFFRMLLFEDHRWKKLQAIFYGTLDGLLGRMGPIRPGLEARLAVQAGAD